MCLSSLYHTLWFRNNEKIIFVWAIILAGIPGKILAVWHQSIKLQTIVILYSFVTVITLYNIDKSSSHKNHFYLSSSSISA